MIKNLEHWSHGRFIDPEVWPQGLQDVPPVNCHLGRLTLRLLARTGKQGPSPAWEEKWILGNAFLPASPSSPEHSCGLGHNIL